MLLHQFSVNTFIGVPTVVTTPLFNVFTVDIPKKTKYHYGQSTYTDDTAILSPRNESKVISNTLKSNLQLVI